MKLLPREHRSELCLPVAIILVDRSGSHPDLSEQAGTGIFVPFLGRQASMAAGYLQGRQLSHGCSKGMLGDWETLP